MLEDRFENWQPPELVDGQMTKWHWVVKGVDSFRLGSKTDIGAFTYIHAVKGVTIEDNVQIGGGCRIYSVSTIDQKEGPVIIRKNALIGAGTTILPGVTIGENSIIGAHSLVKDNVPDNAVAWGVPAKIKGEIINGKIVLNEQGKR